LEKWARERWYLMGQGPRRAQLTRLQERQVRKLGEQGVPGRYFPAADMQGMQVRKREEGESREAKVEM
jgi:hypothetical protein